MYKRNGIALVDHTDSVFIKGARKPDNLFFVSSPKLIDNFLGGEARSIPMDDMKVKLIVVPDVVAISIYVEKMREMIDIHSTEIVNTDEKFVFATWKIKNTLGMSVVILATNGNKNLLNFKNLIETEKSVVDIDVDFDSISEVLKTDKFDIFEVA